MHFYRSALPCFVLLVAGCAEIDEMPVGKCRNVLSQLEVRSPIADARHAVKQGDRRFLGVNEHTTLFPRVPDGKFDLIGKHGYREMEKTSDAIEDDSCLEYQEAARRFAEAYDAEILRLSGVPR